MLSSFHSVRVLSGLLPQPCFVLNNVVTRSTLPPDFQFMREATHFVRFCRIPSPSEPVPAQCGLPIQGMRLLSRLIIFLPDFDCLIRLTGNQSQTCFVKRRTQEAGFRIQRPRLRDAIQVLETIAALPIPKAHAAVVTAREEHVV